MNFDITTTEWQQVENLVDNTTYVLQAKIFSDNFFSKNYNETNVLFVQNTTIPTNNKTGLLVDNVKFKKVSGTNIYIKAIGTPTNIDIQEVQ